MQPSTVLLLGLALAAIATVLLRARGLLGPRQFAWALGGTSLGVALAIGWAGESHG